MSAKNKADPAQQHVKFTCTVSYLDTFIDSVDSFRDEGKLVFTEDNVYTKVNDPANVAMCISRIKGQALNSLEINDAEELSVGVDFGRVLDCLSTVSSTSDLEVTWPIDDGGAHMMRIDVIDDDVQFEIPTLDPSTVPALSGVDPLSHKSQVRVGGSELKKAVQQAGTMISSDGRGIKFETYGETLAMSSSDKTEGKFRKEFHNHDPSVEEGLGEHSTNISIDYLEDIKTIFTQGQAVTVHVKQDNPVRFDIDLDEAGDAQVIYIIAPRLDTN